MGHVREIFIHRAQAQAPIHPVCFPTAAKERIGARALGVWVWVRCSTLFHRQAIRLRRYVTHNHYIVFSFHVFASARMESITMTMDAAATPDTQMSIDEILIQIQALNSSIVGLTGASRENAQQDRDVLVATLMQAAKTNWRSKVRLTIIDSNAKYHREDIVFRNTDGTEASPEDVVTAQHILVMPLRERYTVAQLDDLTGLIKLDQAEVDWMPIINNQKFLILRFSSGRLYVIANSYGIRALTHTGS
jgi:hypothetical protein